MIQTLTGYDAMLKKFYQDFIVDVLNSSTFLLSIFEKADNFTVSGKQIILPARLRRNPSAGFRPDGTADTSNLPVAGSQITDDIVIPLKYYYGRGGFTGPTVEQSRDNIGAFATAVEFEMNRLLLDMLDDFNFYCYGDGTGLRAQVRTAGGGLSSVDVLWAGTSTEEAGQPGTRYLKPGMSVRIGTAAEIAAGTADVTTITGITDGDTFTVSPTVTVAVNDLIVEGDSSATSYNNTILGLLAAINNDTGTYLGISRSTYPEWRGNVLSNAGVLWDLSLNLLQSGLDMVHFRSRSAITHIIGDYSARQEYLNLVAPDRRYMDNNFEGGFSYLEYNGGSGPVRFYFDKYCPYNRIFLLDRSSWRTYTVNDFHFVANDGRILVRAANRDNYEFWVRWIGNIACVAPNSNGVIRDVNVGLTSIYAPFQAA